MLLDTHTHPRALLLLPLTHALSQCADSVRLGYSVGLDERGKVFLQPKSVFELAVDTQLGESHSPRGAGDEDDETLVSPQGKRRKWGGKILTSPSLTSPEDDRSLPCLGKGRQDEDGLDGDDIEKGIVKSISSPPMFMKSFEEKSVYDIENISPNSKHHNHVSKVRACTNCSASLVPATQTLPAFLFFFVRSSYLPNFSRSNNAINTTNPRRLTLPERR